MIRSILWWVAAVAASVVVLFTSAPTMDDIAEAVPICPGESR